MRHDPMMNVSILPKKRAPTGIMALRSVTSNIATRKGTMSSSPQNGNLNRNGCQRFNGRCKQLYVVTGWLPTENCKLQRSVSCTCAPPVLKKNIRLVEAQRMPKLTTATLCLYLTRSKWRKHNEGALKLRWSAYKVTGVSLYLTQTEKRESRKS